MERGFILLVVATLMVFLAPSVKATAHLSFAANRTEVNITRGGCGSTKLCVETPTDCDPAGNGMCLFGSIAATSPMAPTGSNLTIELRGNSAGYVALGLTVNASEGSTMLFVCAQNKTSNGTFFRTVVRNNTHPSLMPVERVTRDIRIRADNDIIQCAFVVPGVNATAMRDAHVTTFQILLGTGAVNGGNLGEFNITLNSGSLNVADPNANNANTTTTAPGSGAGSLLYSHAVLTLLSFSSLFVVFRV